ncbi:MAG: MogA/MoaB family molybdenum cofactor biosynthesis protein [Trueperaceae bacterium]
MTTITSGREAHQNAGPESVLVALLTISDTRTLENDTSGEFLETALTDAGHKVVERAIVKDEPGQIRETLERLLESEAQVVITSGGTGITGRDNTVPIVELLILKPMPGFGELFRMLSYQEVGAAAMLSRALGGLAKGALLFALPGSSNAVKTAWDKLLKDELSHLVFEMVRHEQ